MKNIRLYTNEDSGSDKILVNMSNQGHTGKQGPRTLEDPGPLRTQDSRGPRTLEDPGS